MPANVRAGWTTRKDGSSRAPFDSFNVAHHVGDEAESVFRNRQRLISILGGNVDIHWLNQTHSSVVVDAQLSDLTTPQDASFTRQPNVACCVMTADCLPVFFWQAGGQQVAVAHAGWRGLANDILAQTLKQFDDPNKVFCGIGPAISQSSFEVGKDVLGAFEHWSNSRKYFKKQSEPDKYLCDLPGLAALQLSNLGVRVVYRSHLCSYGELNDFYSYRREGQTGRMANLIWIQE